MYVLSDMLILYIILYMQVHALGEKAVIVAHSMGGNFMLFFFQWVTKHRGLKWVDEHVHALVMIAAPALGVPKYKCI